MNIIKSRYFILLVIFMATRQQQSTNYKWIFFWFLLITLGFVLYWIYLFWWKKHIEKEISDIQTDISQAQTTLDNFSNIEWYDKLKYVQQLENDSHMMPWSDHIKAIMEIFDDLLAVDNSDTFNIAFSDFEISLEEIRLNWYVTNLRILYQWSNSKPWLIQRFEELDFLDDIAIRTYEKSDDDLGYDFTLTANVINNGK